MKRKTALLIVGIFVATLMAFVSLSGTATAAGPIKLTYANFSSRRFRAVPSLTPRT
jgi:hypothetical protein